MANRWCSCVDKKRVIKIPPDLYYAPRESHSVSSFHFSDGHVQVLFSSFRNDHLLHICIHKRISYTSADSLEVNGTLTCAQRYAF